MPDLPAQTGWPVPPDGRAGPPTGNGPWGDHGGAVWPGAARERMAGTAGPALSDWRPRGPQDLAGMMVAGFSTTWISALYLVAQVFLFVHLAHGIQSVFQTLGLVAKRFVPAVRLLGYGISGLIFVGNLAIVLAVWLGYVKEISGS